LLRGNYIAMHATVLYRREVLISAGGFDPSLRACEDYDLYLRIARVAPIEQHDAIVAEYRRHEANMSRDPVLMLRSAQAALRAQWPHVQGSRRGRAAYRAGLRSWRRYYGERLMKDAHTLVGASAWGQALRRMRLLARHYPPGLLKLLAQMARIRAGDELRSWRARRARPALGRVRFGDLRRGRPIDRDFGYGRGRPIDRYYIEHFLARQRADVRGRVLEVGDDAYTRQFGGERVVVRDVLHITPGNPAATIVADLTRADHIPSDAFDCIIFTQTLHLIYDLRAAIATLHRILKPGGVLLATTPGISQISRDEWAESWWWSFTSRSAGRLFREVFPPANVVVEAHGNVLAATAQLHGLGAEELRPEELDRRDPQYEVLITLRAVKPPVAP
jgi:SAM-dependent methyltransferase